MTDSDKLSRSVKIGILTSALLSAFYLVTERTSWLQKTPIVCGGWVETKFVKTTDIQKDILSKNGRTSFCVREVLRPYSESMADIWAGVTIFPNQFNDGKMLYVESQYFVAKDFGEDGFSDEPGDWVSKNSRVYSPYGILIQKNDADVSSAVSSYLDSESTIQLWNLMQNDLSKLYTSRDVSWFRLISENATQISIIGLAAALAWRSLSKIRSTMSARQGLNSSSSDIASVWTETPRAISLAISSREMRQEILNLTIVFIILLSGWAVFRYTNWLRPASFKCNTYPSELIKGDLRFCFNEILSLPNEGNQSIVIGVTADDGVEMLSSMMEFYVADGNNATNFKDEEGDWAFLGYQKFDSKTGFLIDRSDVTTSVWYDTVIPADVQMRLWLDVRDDLAKNYGAKRLSITRKITDVLGSFAALGGAVLIAVITFVRAVELALYRENYSSEK